MIRLYITPNSWVRLGEKARQDPAPPYKDRNRQVHVCAPTNARGVFHHGIDLDHWRVILNEQIVQFDHGLSCLIHQRWREAHLLSNLQTDVLCQKKKKSAASYFQTNGREMPKEYMFIAAIRGSNIKPRGQNRLEKRLYSGFGECEGGILYF